MKNKKSKTTKKKPKVSVVVSTYNRDQLLKLCLDSLNSQTASKNSFQVIVVDNFPTKSTEKLVRKYQNAKYINEKMPGLSHARNKGWKSAKHDLIAFIDDDAIAKKHWIKEIIKFANKQPKASIFGGPYQRHSLVDIPDWIPQNFGQKNLSNKQKKLTPKKEWLSGTNIIIKKILLKKLNGFDTNLGMKGKNIGYAEETDFQARAIYAGESIYYSPQIVVSHLFDKRKHKLSWLLKNSYFSGKYSKTTEDNKRNLLERFADLAKGTVQFFAWILKPKKIPVKLRVFKALEKLVYELGTLTRI